MSYTEKVDVLELLINCLKEHEDKIDSLVSRLETVSEMVPVSVMIKKTGTSIGITIPKDTAIKYGYKVGDHIHAYLQKRG